MAAFETPNREAIPVYKESLKDSGDTIRSKAKYVIETIAARGGNSRLARLEKNDLKLNDPARIAVPTNRVITKPDITKNKSTPR